MTQSKFFVLDFVPIDETLMSASSRIFFRLLIDAGVSPVPVIPIFLDVISPNAQYILDRSEFHHIVKI